MGFTKCKLLCAVLTAAAMLSAPVPAADVLFMCANPATPSVADAAVQARLQGLGFNVVMAPGTEPVTSADGKILIVVSRTIGSAEIGARFNAVTVPMLTWESNAWDDQLLCTAASSVLPSTQIVITDSTHPLASGFSGNVTVFSVSSNVSQMGGTLGSGGRAIATSTGSINCYFYYDEGAMLTNNTPCPARRVGFFTDDTSHGNLTADGWKLFEASVNWLIDDIGVTDDSYQWIPNSTLTVDATSGILANDVNSVGTATITQLSSPSSGALVLNQDGSFDYTPVNGFQGRVNFTYSIADSYGLASGTATVTIDITNAANQAPTANQDLINAIQNRPEIIPISTLLANDTDPEDETLKLVRVSATSLRGGTLVSTSSTVTYTPPAGFAGQDSFTYTIKDTVNSVNGTVTVNVLGNKAPITATDFISTRQGLAVTVSATVLLANDTDPESDPLALTSVTATSASGGLVDLTADVITYTPPSGFSGVDTFQYTAADAAHSSLGTVVVDVSSNLPPVANPDSIGPTNEATALLTSIAIFTGNDSDPEGDPITLTAVSPTSTNGGTVSILGFTVQYVPAAGFYGDDTFTYTLADSYNATSTGNVTVRVNPVNPVAVNDSVSAVEDTDKTIDASFLLANDLAPAGDILVVQSVAAASANGGTVSLAGTTVTYRGALNFFGADSFVYTILDTTRGTTTSGSVIVSVSGTQDPPSANADFAGGLGDAVLHVNAPGVLGNDIDVDGDALTASIVSLPAHGTLTLNANGEFFYTPFAGYIGSDAFVYQCSDGRGGVSSAQCSLLVTTGSGNNPLPGDVDGDGIPNTVDKDSDNDGFSDIVEAGMETSPINAASTPFHGKPAGLPILFNIASLTVKLNFARSGRDTITLTGSLPIGAGTGNLEGQRAGIGVGNVVVGFDLTGKGKGTSRFGDKMKIDVSRLVVGMNAKFSFNLKGAFAEALAENGLTQSVDPAQQRQLPVLVLFNDRAFQLNKSVIYGSKAGRSGTAKSSLSR